MSQQQIIVQPLGLITQPNKLGTFPPGALQNAEGVYMRDPNIVEVGQYFGSGYSASPPSTVGTNAIYLFPAPQNVPTSSLQHTLMIWDASSGTLQRYSYVNSGGTNTGTQSLLNSEGQFQFVSLTGRITSINARGRQLVNCNQAVLAVDLGSGSLAPRTAGMLPVTAFRTSTAGTGGAIPAGNQCHYSAVIRRVFSDGYEVISAPSAAIWQYLGGGLDSQLGVSLVSAYHKAGDIVDIYRTISQVESTNSGANFYLVGSHTVTAADIAAGQFIFTDNTNDATMGESLYTNPGAQTAAGAANPPPTCKVMVMFKGHALYLNCIDPPERKVAVGVFMGVMLDGAAGVNAYARKNGIGTRTVRCTITNGNPTITAVPAADIVGLKIGQWMDDFHFPQPSFVTAVGAASVTFNNNAISGGVGQTVGINDAMEVDGVVYRMGSANDFASFPGRGANGSVVTQLLDRILPEDFGAGITNPETVFADGAILSRWFLADGRAGNMTLRATNGTNYVPPIPELLSGTPVETVTSTVRLNGASWSEQNQPERVCPGSLLPVGSGEIYAAFSTRDAVWIFASDGLWRWSGTGGSAGDGYDWRVDPVDSTLSIAGPLAGCVLRDTVFAYTNRGFVSIDSSGNIKELSQGRLNDLLPGPQWTLPAWSSTVAMWMIADETHDEILFTSNLTLGGISYVYVYNLLTDAFTRLNCGSTVSGTININGANGNYPSHAAYVRQGEAVIFADRSSSSVLCQTPNSYGPHLVHTQPVYADNPFNLRHWQTLNFAFANQGTFQPIQPFFNGFAGNPVNAILVSLGGYLRTSITIPRNTPAIANQISVGFVGAGPNSTSRRLLSMCIDYVDLTDQRVKR